LLQARKLLKLLKLGKELEQKQQKPEPKPESSKIQKKPLILNNKKT